MAAWALAAARPWTSIRSRRSWMLSTSAVGSGTSAVGSGGVNGTGEPGEAVPPGTCGVTDGGRLGSPSAWPVVPSGFNGRSVGSTGWVPSPGEPVTVSVVGCVGGWKLASGCRWSVGCDIGPPRSALQLIRSRPGTTRSPNPWQGARLLGASSGHRGPRGGRLCPWALSAYKDKPETPCVAWCHPPA